MYLFGSVSTNLLWVHRLSGKTLASSPVRIGRKIRLSLSDCGGFGNSFSIALL